MFIEEFKSLFTSYVDVYKDKLCNRNKEVVHLFRNDISDMFSIHNIFPIVLYGGRDADLIIRYVSHDNANDTHTLCTIDFDRTAFDTYIAYHDGSSTTMKCDVTFTIAWDKDLNNYCDLNDFIHRKRY